MIELSYRALELYFAVGRSDVPEGAEVKDGEAWRELEHITNMGAGNVVTGLIYIQLAGCDELRTFDADAWLTVRYESRPGPVFWSADEDLYRHQCSPILYDDDAPDGQGGGGGVPNATDWPTDVDTHFAPESPENAPERETDLDFRFIRSFDVTTFRYGPGRGRLVVDVSYLETLRMDCPKCSAPRLVLLCYDDESEYALCPACWTVHEMQYFEVVTGSHG